MKIIKKAELLKQKRGTVFSFYDNNTFGRLGVFLSARGEDDFIYQSTTNIDCHTSCEESVLKDAEENGTEFMFDSNCAESEGDFCDAKLYAIWDESDLRRLKHLLSQFQ